MSTSIPTSQQQPYIATWSLGTCIKESRGVGGGCYLNCRDRPLLLLSLSLIPPLPIPPSTASHPPIFNTCQHAVSCLLGCRRTDLPGDGSHGRDGETGRQTEGKTSYEINSSLRCTPEWSVVAHNRRDPFLWTQICTANLVLLALPEHKDNLEQKHWSFRAVSRSLYWRKDKKRVKEKEEIRATLCPARKNSKVRSTTDRWGASKAADWTGGLLPQPIMSVITRRFLSVV